MNDTPAQEPSDQRGASLVGSSGGFGEVDALTRYIITSALIYSQGQWSGVDVARDMIRAGGITAAEICRITKDYHERRKLLSFLPNVPIRHEGA